MPTDLRNSGGDGRSDDWLSGSGEFDWGDSPPAPGRALGTRTARKRAGAADEPLWDPSDPGGRPDEATIRRRRITWLAVALAAIGVIVLALATLGGGSGGGKVVSQPPTTPVETPTTTPTTTPKSSTTPKTTSTASTTPAAPSASTLTLADGQTLKLTSSGADVTALQQALKTLGLDPGPIDGDFGAKTAAAVGDFQRAHGLGDDGVVGPATLAALNAALSAG